MEKNTETNPQKVTWKKTKIGCLVLIVLMFVGMCATNSEEKTTPENAFNKIMPVDIYLNYKKQGFDVNDSYSPEAGHLWTCTRSSSGIKETVTVFSNSVDYIENAQVLVQLEPTLKKPEAALYSLQYMVTMPFEGNSDDKCQELQQWVIDNLYNDKAETTCGDVKFILHAPTNMVRMLTVEKNRE